MASRSMRTATLAMALFDGPGLGAELERRMSAALDEVQALDEDYLLTVQEDELVGYLAGKYGMGIATIRQGDVRTVASSKADRDGFGTPMLNATIQVPFDGPPTIFGFQPNLYGPPHPDAVVQGGALVLDHRFAYNAQPDWNAIINPLLGRIQIFLQQATSQVEQHNAALENQVRGVVITERERALAARAALADLTIPVEERPDAPATYAAPAARHTSGADLLRHRARHGGAAG